EVPTYLRTLHTYLYLIACPLASRIVCDRQAATEHRWGHNTKATNSLRCLSMPSIHLSSPSTGHVMRHHLLLRIWLCARVLVESGDKSAADREHDH
ncbi:hypothetical protein MGG_16913, partial [Pyricularia oryzae 70-15]